MRILRKHREAVALTLILILAAFLSAYRIWDLGYSNEFYAASVKSMLTSWKNFFFASLDPGGWITVDKPPVSLWVQAAFAKVFGFYGWSIILPQCLAAVGTVLVIYSAVKRQFGSAAGLISALVLALSPIFIIVSKTNNTDSVLIFFMALSAWAMVKACGQGRLRYLLLSIGVPRNCLQCENVRSIFNSSRFVCRLSVRRKAPPRYENPAPCGGGGSPSGSFFILVGGG